MRLCGLTSSVIRYARSAPAGFHRARLQRELVQAVAAQERSASVGPRALTKLIKKSTSLKEAGSLLVQHNGSFNHIHTSAFVAHLAQLSAAQKLQPEDRPALEQLLRRWSKTAALQVPYFDPRAVSNTVYALGKLRYSDPTLLQRLLDSSAASLTSYEPQQLSNFVWGLANLGVRPSEAWLASFQAASAAALPASKPQAVANTLHALSRLGVQPESRWTQQLWASSSDMSQYSDEEVVTVMHAVAQLQLEPSADWTAGCVGTLTRRLESDSFNLGLVTSVALSLARLKWPVQQQDDLHAGILQILESALPATEGPSSAEAVAETEQLRRWPRGVLTSEQAVEAQLALTQWSKTLQSADLRDRSRRWLLEYQAVAYDRLGSYSPRALCETLLQLSKAAVHPSGAWLSAFMHHSRKQLPNFNPQDLSHVMYGFAKMACVPEDAWLAEYFERSTQQLPSYSSQHLANTIYALAKLDTPPDSAWMRAYWQQVCTKLDSFTDQGLVMLLYGLAKLGRSMRDEEGGGWLQPVLQRVDARLDGFGPKCVANTLWALAKLQHDIDELPADLVDRLAQGAVRHAKALTPVAAVNSVVALSKLQAPSAATAAAGDATAAGTPAWLASLAPRLRLQAQARQLGLAELLQLQEALKQMRYDSSWLSKPIKWMSARDKKRRLRSRYLRAAAGGEGRTAVAGGGDEAATADSAAVAGRAPPSGSSSGGSAGSSSGRTRSGVLLGGRGAGPVVASLLLLADSEAFSSPASLTSISSSSSMLLPEAKAWAHGRGAHTGSEKWRESMAKRRRVAGVVPDRSAKPWADKKSAKPWQAKWPPKPTPEELAALGPRPGLVFANRLVTVVNGPDPRTQVPELLLSVPKRPQKQRLNYVTMPSGDVVAILRALSAAKNAGCSIPEDWFDHFQVQARSSLKRWPPYDIANAIKAFADMDTAPRPFYMMNFFNHSVPKLELMSTVDLTNIAHSIVKLRIKRLHIPLGWKSNFIKAVASKMQSISQDDLRTSVVLLRGTAHVGLPIDAEMLTHWSGILVASLNSKKVTATAVQELIEVLEAKFLPMQPQHPSLYRVVVAARRRLDELQLSATPAPKAAAAPTSEEK